MKKILVRFDDLCPTMNKEQWEKAKVLLKQYDVKPLLGVVPECRDPELLIDKEDLHFWEEMRSLQKEGYTLAMHGCFHECIHQGKTLVSGPGYSEFAGRSYEDQYATIKKGKEILEEHGIHTTIFFAPRHSYDLNTLKALAANGFTHISDGKSHTVWNREGILCVPCRSSGCPAIRFNGYYTAVFHAHEWVREDKAFAYKEFVSLLENHQQDIVDFNEFASRKEGHPFVQMISEKAFIFYENHIRPKLSALHVLIKRRGRKNGRKT